MKSDFQFSNLVGTVYKQGNLVFVQDGSALLSPVGNRISHFDLVNNKSFTFAFEHRKNIARIALSPQGTLLLSVDEDGRAILTNFIRRNVIYHFNFKSPPTCLAFSPSGRFFAIGLGKQLQIWRTPGFDEAREREFAPFVKYRSYHGHYKDITSVAWSGDSRFLVTTGKDLTARVWSLDPVDGFTPTTLSGHKDTVVGAFFSADQEIIYTVSRDGALFQWTYQLAEGIEDETSPEADMRWRILQKHYFLQPNAKVTATSFHQSTNLLSVGFSSGVFSIYELPDFTQIQSLSISKQSITTLAQNTTSEWIALGSSKLGQLLVWEWQSESYILRQQGHFDSLNCVAYTHDGSKVTTASDDGKIKLWDTTSGHCIVTFADHSSGVTAIEHPRMKRNVFYTASLDGTVRAYDLTRYRNFRTFTAPEQLQFTCLATDTSGEVIAAGSLDSYDIHLWSVQTGQLLDRLAGHEGPISCVKFAEQSSLLVSGSWDRTIRVWDIFGRSKQVEPLQMTSDIQCLALRPDGKELCSAGLDGQIIFWDIFEGVQTNVIDGKLDISGGRLITDRRSAANSAANKNFTSLCYTGDGQCILAGGTSKWICLYDVETGGLINKFSVSENLSLDGTQRMLNSRDMTEAGPRQLLNTQGDESDLEDRIDRTLPGSTRGDASTRRVRPEVRTRAVQLSPTGRGFAAATTEGLLLYSLDKEIIFDPYELDIDITPTTILAALKRKEYLKSLLMSLRLSQSLVSIKVIEGIPPSDIPLVIREFPESYLSRLLRFLNSYAEKTPHVEFYLLWCSTILTRFGRVLKSGKGEYAAQVRNMQKDVLRIKTELQSVGDEIGFVLGYIFEHEGGPAPRNGITDTDMEDGSEEDNEENEMDDEEDEDGEWIGKE